MKTTQILLLCLIGMSIQISISEAKKKNDPRLPALAGVQQVDASSIDQPERPVVFRNKAELMNYLKRLNEFYAIVGRPRFGKRSSSSLDDYLSDENFEDLVEPSLLSNDDDYLSTLLQNRKRRSTGK